MTDNEVFVFLAGIGLGILIAYAWLAWRWAKWMEGDR